MNCGSASLLKALSYERQNQTVPGRYDAHHGQGQCRDSLHAEHEPAALGVRQAYHGPIAGRGLGGTVSKLGDEVAGISSKYFFGYQLPGPDWVQVAVKKKFE
jgi:hypothetical protein